MYSGKLAVIGDKDIVLAFKAAGMDVFAAADAAQAEDVLKRQAKNYCVIFITEDLAAHMGETLEKYKRHRYPHPLLVGQRRLGNGGHKGGRGTRRGNGYIV